MEVIKGILTTIVLALLVVSCSDDVVESKPVAKLVPEQTSAKSKPKREQKLETAQEKNKSVFFCEARSSNEPIDIRKSAANVDINEARSVLRSFSSVCPSPTTTFVTSPHVVRTAFKSIELLNEYYCALEGTRWQSDYSKVITPSCVNEIKLLEKEYRKEEVTLRNNLLQELHELPKTKNLFPIKLDLDEAVRKEGVNLLKSNMGFGNGSDEYPVSLWAKFDEESVKLLQISKDWNIYLGLSKEHEINEVVFTVKQGNYYQESMSICDATRAKMFSSDAFIPLRWWDGYDFIVKDSNGDFLLKEELNKRVRIPAKKAYSSNDEQIVAECTDDMLMRIYKSRYRGESPYKSVLESLPLIKFQEALFRGEFPALQKYISKEKQRQKSLADHKQGMKSLKSIAEVCPKPQDKLKNGQVDVYTLYQATILAENYSMLNLLELDKRMKLITKTITPECISDLSEAGKQFNEIINEAKVKYKPKKIAPKFFGIELDKPLPNGLKISSNNTGLIANDKEDWDTYIVHSRILPDVWYEQGEPQVKAYLFTPEGGTPVVKGLNVNLASDLCGTLLTPLLEEVKSKGMMLDMLYDPRLGSDSDSGSSAGERYFSENFMVKLECQQRSYTGNYVDVFAIKDPLYKPDYVKLGLSELINK